MLPDIAKAVNKKAEIILETHITDALCSIAISASSLVAIPFTIKGRSDIS